MIIASITSWKKRITTLSKIIYWFYAKQTIKPDLFYLTLAEEEFPNKEKDLPNDLLLLISQSNINIELNWVKKNIYAHKKYEVFKKYANNYIFLIDDDILYPADHIEKLLKLSYQYNDKVICCYYTSAVDYIHKKMQYCNEFDIPSLKNLLLSGLACFPPNILNLNIFNYNDLRDEFCQKCDDSWVKAWSIKCNIPIVGYKKWTGGGCLTTINGTQEVSIWKTFNSKKINGINQKVLNFINAIKIFKIESEIKKIWINFY